MTLCGRVVALKRMRCGYQDVSHSLLIFLMMNLDVVRKRKGERSQGWVLGLQSRGVGVPFIDWGWEWEVGTCFLLNVCPHPHSHLYVETYSPV